MIKWGTGVRLNNRWKNNKSNIPQSDFKCKTGDNFFDNFSGLKQHLVFYFKANIIYFFQEKYQVGVKSTYPRATDTILIFLFKKAPIFVNTFRNCSGLGQHTEIYYSSFWSIFYPT